MTEMNGRIEFLERRLEAAYAEKAALEELAKVFGTRDDWAEDTVLLFKRSFGTPQQYTYAAVKAGGFWYVTGRSQNGFKVSYSHLKSDFLYNAYKETGEVWFVSELTRVEEAFR